METGTLIRSLAAEVSSSPASGAIDRLTLRLFAATALGLTAVVSAVLFGLGPRPDLGRAIFTWPVALKFVLALSLAAIANALVRRLIEPGVPMPRWAALALIGPIALVLVAGAGLGSGETRAATAFTCAAMVALLSLGPLAVVLLALRAGAPTRPGLAGGAAGILAGAIAVFGYALFCPLDFVPLVILFYLVGIAAAAAAGALLGRWVLAW